jgi:CDP-diacylglycerol---serine O-phosphatidyltransferase
MKNYKVIIPNFFTALSLVSGLFALHFTYEDNYITAAWLIAFSMLCDGLDGKLARLLNATSKFGATFDTLSDFVVFGVVPAILAYKIALHNLSIWGIIISLFYVFSGGYRLVRFSHKKIKPDTNHSFIGLPIPAGAGLIVSFIIFSLYSYNKIVSIEIFVLTIFISSVLMVSTIEYLPIEKKAKMTKESKFFILLALISVVLSFRFSYIIFVGWIILYVLYGIIRHIILTCKNDT